MNNTATHPDTRLTTATLLVRGNVQGVGMRPMIARLAAKLRLAGFVRNSIDGVQVRLQGRAGDIAEFCHQLPAGIVVEDFVSDTPTLADIDEFRILDSDTTDFAVATTVPVDTAFCDSCRNNVLDCADRRFCYPFTNCAECGPRYSLLRSMPYDRASTSMTDFVMCSACKGEYDSFVDRRFHAQTNACPNCGPKVTFADFAANTSAGGSNAIRLAASAIREGRIVALKGVGGYQFVCDATSTSAVERLRQRKNRPRKPLAVMVASIDDARQLAVIGPLEAATLTEATNPIVLCSAHPDSSLAASVHPGLNCVGLMLPSTPQHLLLVNEIGLPCVVTSGNVNGAPLTYRDSDRTELHEVADVRLEHDREIVRPIDDSVVRCIANQRVTIRAARGIAPLRLDINTEQQILAVGGHQKVALALSNGQQAVLGPHIGDMNAVAARQRFVEQAAQFRHLYNAKPAVVAHDLHPDFFTTQWAREQSLPTVAVQHHHAHVVAGMVEHGWLDREVLGVAFDGTGYGTDGTIWGGEFLLCSATTFRRIARIRPFALPGGEHAVRQPWRVALALVQEAADAETATEFLRSATSSRNLNQVSQLLKSKRTAFSRTSSAGRLFDGIAALLLQLSEATYEGEPAMLLEAICDQNVSGLYPLPLVDADIIELDWRPMVCAILSDKRNGATTSAIATRFVRTLAAAIISVCEWISEFPVVLSGGCFQNAFLTEETARLLSDHRHPVGLPGRIPCNDGGLAAGQLAVAAAQLAASQPGAA